MSVESRTCALCGQEKPLTDFHRHRKGRLKRCRDCVKQYYDRYKSRPAVLARERGRDATRRLAEKTKKKARRDANHAIRDGKFHREACRICGAKAEMHHPDYSKPLDVVWLCSKHHHLVHQEEAEKGERKHGT